MRVALALELERRRLAPGEEVRGRVQVTSSGDPCPISVSLALFEVTDNCGRRAVPETVQSRPLHSGRVETGMTFPFALGLPADSPPGHRSTHGGLVWIVSALADPGAHGTGEERELEVALRSTPRSAS